MSSSAATFLRRNILLLLAFLIITVPTFIHIVNNKYFPIHDDQSIARLYLLDLGIKQGIVYPRWVDQLAYGFGYPLFNFYPPLVYYLGEVFHLMGFSFVWSIKLVMIAGFMGGSVGMYMLARKYANQVVSLVASILYTYFTYHAVVLYVRGALAEFFSSAVLPFLFLAIVNVARSRDRRSAMWLALAFALTILTHPLIAFPSLFFVGLFFVFYFFTTPSADKLEFVLYAVGGFIGGLLLSAFFWLPSIIEKKFTLANTTLITELSNYGIHYVYPQQFFYSAWGYGGSIAGPYDGLSFQLGKVHIGLVLLSIICAVLYFVKKKKFDSKLQTFTFLFLTLLFSLFMCTYLSSFAWDRIQFLWFLQFPWRFLTFAGIFISLVSIYFFIFLKELVAGKKEVITKSLILIAAFTISAITIFIYQKYFRPQSYIDVTDSQRTSYDEIAWRISRTSHEFAPKDVATKKTELGITAIDIDQAHINRQVYTTSSKDVVVQTVKNSFIQKEFQINSPSPITFQLHTFNFPGWTAYVNGNHVAISDKNKYKLITIHVPKGESTLLFQFKDTPVRKAGNTISVISFFTVVVYFGVDLWNKRSKATEA